MTSSSNGIHEVRTHLRPAWRRRLLHAFQSSLAVAGVDRSYVSRRGLAGAVILMYHSVGGSGQAGWIDPGNQVPGRQFERQMRFLSRCRRVVSLTELVLAVNEGRTMPAGTVVLTFDDGYLDNLSVAAPVLQKYGHPATVFLATRLIERAAPPWVDRLYAIFRTRSRSRLRIEEADEEFDLDQPGQQFAAYQHLAKVMIPMSVDDCEQRLGALARAMGSSFELPQLTMSWDDVRTLRMQYPMIDLGVHTRNHVDLSSRDERELREELASCVQDFERELCCRPRHFVFPYNRPSQTAVTILKQMSFQSAGAVENPELVTRESDPFWLPRISPPTSMLRYRFVTSGAHPQLSTRLFGRA